MDKIETYISKINAVDRFNAGEVKLANADEALTGLFNGFLRYLLDEWVDGPPIPPKHAPEAAQRVIEHLRFGLRQPDYHYIKEMINGPDAMIFPLISVRWLMRNASISVMIPQLGQEWNEFVSHYRHVILAIRV